MLLLLLLFEKDLVVVSLSDLHQQKSGRGHDAGSEQLVMREKKLVDKYLIKSGMLRFSFLLECCQPGSFPDSQLMAAMLDLVGCGSSPPPASLPPSLHLNFLSVLCMSVVITLLFSLVMSSQKLCNLLYLNLFYGPVLHPLLGKGLFTCIFRMSKFSVM